MLLHQLTDRMCIRSVFIQIETNYLEGGVAMAIVTFFLHPKPIVTALTSTREKIASLDLLGTSLFIPAIVCLLLALEVSHSLEY